MEHRGTAQDRIEVAKNTAAVKALEAYVRTLKDMLTPEELAGLDLDKTEHIHTALLVEDKATLALIAHWSFSKDPELVEKVLRTRTIPPKADA